MQRPARLSRAGRLTLAGTPEPEESQGIYRFFLRIIPLGALAFLLTLVMERWSGQANAFDTAVYPVAMVGLMVLLILLSLKPRALPVVALSLVLGACTFLVGQLVFLLFFASSRPDLRTHITESFFWLPVVYLFCFLMPWERVGRAIARTFTLLTFAVSVLYAVPRLGIAEERTLIFALFQLNLASLFLMGLTLGFIGVKVAAARARWTSETSRRFANKDVLTNLPNRRMLEHALEQAIERCRSEGGLLALLLLDLDGFKVVNDMLGHRAGDALLRKVAERFLLAVRRDGFLARLSGDEFVVLVQDIDSPLQAQAVATQLQEALMAPFEVAGQSFTFTASIGISFCPADAQSSAELLRHADSAMFRVKRSGKNGIGLYRGHVDAVTEAWTEIERDLRVALEKGEFSLHYQPMYDLRDNRLVKLEALLRWHHPTRGLVAPTDFVPVAERSGLIVPLGLEVLDEACRQAALWRRRGYRGFRIAVNVSALQFAQPDFVEQVRAALARHKLPAERLELELTESIVMSSMEAVAETLQELRRLGVRLAIDDFGTGYSALAYLRDLPIHAIKIDKSFVRALGVPTENPLFYRALIRAVVDLAAALDLEVVAEGIDREAQRILLRDLGCHVGQGFLFAQPMPPEALDADLAAECLRPNADASAPQAAPQAEPVAFPETQNGKSTLTGELLDAV